MKSLLIAILILGIVCDQNWVSYGTGLADMPYQNQVPEFKQGCLFLACCVVGGLGTKEEALAARSWALSNNYITDTNYVNDKTNLPQYISSAFGTTYHSDFQIKKDQDSAGHTHFWVADSSGKEIFNSAGLGWHR